MEQMFEIAIQIVMAYFQIMMMFFGVVFAVFGISILVSKIQSRQNRGRWIIATVSAIREGEGIADENGVKRKVYYPVFEAVGPSGDMVTYEYKARGFGADKFKIGMRFKVLPSLKDPGFVALEGDAKSDTFITFFLLSAGGMLIALPLYFIPITMTNFVVWGVTGLLMAIKFKKLIKPKHLRETVENFKARRAKEDLAKHQIKREVSQTEIDQQSEKLEKIGTVWCKIAVFAGFLILCAGALGYNAQLKFKDSARFEQSGPCGGELGIDCKRVIIAEDIVSTLPPDFRPAMNGTYHSIANENRMMVDYGTMTHMPYFILMVVGALVILGNSRKLSELK